MSGKERREDWDGVDRGPHGPWQRVPVVSVVGIKQESDAFDRL